MSEYSGRKRKPDHHEPQQPQTKRPRSENAPPPSGVHSQGAHEHNRSRRHEAETSSKYPHPRPGSAIDSCALPHELNPSHIYSLDGLTLPAPPPISPGYAKSVFTHASICASHMTSSNSSYSNHSNTIYPPNYERLEFLGDAHLEHIASHLLYHTYPSSAPGKLSSLREQLVRNETLAKYSRAYGFDKLLSISSPAGEIREWKKICADVFEAYVAAIVLTAIEEDAIGGSVRGFEIATEWMTELWSPILDELAGTKMGNMDVDLKAKEELAKTVMVKGVRLEYKEEKAPLVDRRKGTQVYFMGVYLTGWGYETVRLGGAQGDSKGAAGQAAARVALGCQLMPEIIKRRAKWLSEREASNKSDGDVIQKVVEDGVAPQAEAEEVKKSKLRTLPDAMKNEFLRKLGVDT